MHIDNKLINQWVRKLEFVFTVFWLLYFLNVSLPSPFPSLVNALSYPFIATLVILRWKRLAYVATKDIFLLLFIGFVTGSLLWTSHQGMTINGVRGLLRTFLFGAYIAARYSITEQMRIWGWVFGIAAILSLVTALFIPSHGISATHGSFQGIFPYKNYMAYVMSIGAVFFLLMFLESSMHKWLNLSVLSVTIFLISQSASSAGIVSLFVLILLMPFYTIVKQHYKLRTVILGSILIIVGILSILILANWQFIIVELLGERGDFSGRAPIWNLAIEKGVERLWLGRGFNAFWKSDAGISIMINTWSGFQEEGFNIHNGLLELFLSSGLIGLLLYVTSMVRSFIRIVTLLIYTKKIEFFWSLQLLVFLLLTTLADTYSLRLIYISLSLSIAVESNKYLGKRAFDKSYNYV
ncbi:MAG: O-antigen ligase family protein [Mastigocoleus sp.]